SEYLHCVFCLCFFFFFQAEDGIRDGHVTGVQTCALPIYVTEKAGVGGSGRPSRTADACFLGNVGESAVALVVVEFVAAVSRDVRSEERRVGKEWRSRRWRYGCKKGLEKQIVGGAVRDKIR